MQFHNVLHILSTSSMLLRVPFFPVSNALAIVDSKPIIYAQRNSLQDESLRPELPKDKRALYELPNGWIGRFDKYLALIPVQMANQCLQEFYHRVQIRVMDQWISKPPANHFAIDWEGIQIDFFSPTRTVPWDFIIAFLQKMVVDTALGFTGTYDVSQVLLQARRISTDTFRSSTCMSQQASKFPSACEYPYKLRRHDPIQPGLNRRPYLFQRLNSTNGYFQGANSIPPTKSGPSLLGG